MPLFFTSWKEVADQMPPDIARRGDTSKRGVSDADSNANGFCKANIGGNSTRAIDRVCAEPGAGETRLRARNPERTRQEHGCRCRELSSRRQITGPSSCSVSVHLRLRVVRRY